MSSPVPLAVAAVSRYTCAPVALLLVPAQPALPQPPLSRRWLESTLPACCARGAAVLQPALQLLWAKTAELALRVSELCSSHLAWARDHLPWLLEWVRTGADGEHHGAVLVPAGGTAGGGHGDGVPSKGMGSCEVLGGKQAAGADAHIPHLPS